MFHVEHLISYLSPKQRFPGAKSEQEQEEFFTSKIEPYTFLITFLDSNDMIWVKI